MMKKSSFSWKEGITSMASFIFFLSQLMYGFVFATNSTIQFIEYLGVSVFLLSGIFGLVPVIMFPRRDGVEKGKSFVYTTRLVDTGFYAVVRHPQYAAFMLWAIGAMLLFQNNVVILLGLPVIMLTYFDMMREDKRNMVKVWFSV